MSISHWGMFPGWVEPVPAPNGSFRIDNSGTSRWRPVDFDTFCVVIDDYEERQREEMAEADRVGRH